MTRTPQQKEHCTGQHEPLPPSLGLFPLLTLLLHVQLATPLSDKEFHQYRRRSSSSSSSSLVYTGSRQPQRNNIRKQASELAVRIRMRVQCGRGSAVSSTLTLATYVTQSHSDPVAP